MKLIHDFGCHCQNSAEKGCLLSRFHFTAVATFWVIKGCWDYLFNRQVMNYFLIRHGDKSRHFEDIERQQAILKNRSLNLVIFIE